jgi:uncharacterized protein (TIGR02118 family)
MIKLMVFVKKRSDMTREQFKDYWVHKHSELEKKIFARGRVKQIVATFIGATLVGELAYDGFVELYFDGREDLEATLQEDDDVMKKDEADFCDLAPATPSSPMPAGTMRRSNWYGTNQFPRDVCSARERRAATPTTSASPAGTTTAAASSRSTKSSCRTTTATTPGA